MTMPIDLDTLNELKEIMEDDFDELISIFITDGKNQIEDLKMAINHSKVEDVRRVAHTLKGSSANLGLNILSESCLFLELKAADGSLDDVNDDLEKIISNYEAAKKALEEIF